MEGYIWTLFPAGMGLCVLAAEVGRIKTRAFCGERERKKEKGHEGKKLKYLSFVNHV